MTQIVTVITKDSIFMASDTRLNYNEEVEEKGFCGDERGGGFLGFGGFTEATRL